VQYEEDDGPPKREDGKSVTNIRKMTLTIGANDIEELWKWLIDIRSDPEKNIVAIYEAAPSLVVLQ
jgi:hypothetical protein